MVLVLYILGTLFILWAAVLYFKYIKLKYLTYFKGPLNRELSFEIKTHKLHSLSFVGGKVFKIKDGFNIKIIDSKEKIINPSKSKVKLPFSFNGNPSVEAFYFEGCRGNYRIIIENIEFLELKRNSLPSERLFGETRNANQIGLLVKEAISDKHKILIFVLFILGLLLINLGFTFQL